MKTAAIPSDLRQLAEDQLSDQILPIWTRHAQTAVQGVMGPMDAEGKALTQQPKGSVMNSRALWSFSLLSGLSNKPSLEKSALRLYRGFCDAFVDAKSGRVHWQSPVEDPETFHLLAQTYAIFALSQFAMVCQHDEALTQAEQIAQAMFKHFAREDGTFISQSRLGIDPMHQDVDRTETCAQLHVLEALTELYRARPSESLKRQLTALIDLFLIHIFPDSGDLPLLFDRRWQPQPYETSIGHHFEAPFLVALACRVLNDAQRLHLTEQKLLELTDHSLQSAQLASGYFLYGRDEQGKWRDLLTWWTQVEAANSLQWAYEITGKDVYLVELSRLWKGFSADWADTQYGDWHPQLNQRLQPAGDTNKGDTWRSLYHSTRACVAMKYGFTALEGPNNTKLNNPETHPGEANTASLRPFGDSTLTS